MTCDCVTRSLQENFEPGGNRIITGLLYLQVIVIVIVIVMVVVIVIVTMIVTMIVMVMLTVIDGAGVPAERGGGRRHAVH